MKSEDISEATKYTKSLKDAVKRQFAISYLAWITAGRIGEPPGRGALPLALAKAVCTNLDALT